MTDLLEGRRQVHMDVADNKAPIWLPIHLFEIVHAEETLSAIETTNIETIAGQQDLLAIGFIATRATCSRGIVDIKETYVNDTTIDRWPA